jgi:hypothetical protein
MLCKDCKFAPPPKADTSFFGLAVPEGEDCREIFRSAENGVWTYAGHADQLIQAFKAVAAGGGWSVSESGYGEFDVTKSGSDPRRALIEGNSAANMTTLKYFAADLATMKSAFDHGAH